MTKKVFLAGVFLFAVALVFAQHKTLEIGEKAPLPTYKMENIDGKWLTFNDVKEKNGTLVIFSSNTCPFVIAWEDRYTEVGKLAGEKSVGIVLVNSNHENRNGVDSKEAMIKHASEYNYNWPYVIDEMSKLANAYGAMTTPHVYLFDKNDKLVFIGAIDDNHKSASMVKSHYLKDAIEALAAGKEIAEAKTRATGCSIKRP